MKSQPSVRTASQQCIVAWRPDLLGGVEQSSPSAAKWRPGGAGLDGECAHRAIIPYARCAPSSDSVRGVEYRFLHVIGVGHRARHWLNRCGRTSILRTRNRAADSHDNNGEQRAKRPHLLILTPARASINHIFLRLIANEPALWFSTRQRLSFQVAS